MLHSLKWLCSDYTAIYREINLEKVPSGKLEVKRSQFFTLHVSEINRHERISIRGSMTRMDVEGRRRKGILTEAEVDGQRKC